VIHAARRALEPSLARGGDSAFIVTRDQHVLLAAPGGLTVDAVEFERLAAAAIAGDRVESCEDVLALYSGDLLVENRYDEWLDARRDRLRSLRLDVLDRIAAIHEARGDEWASAAAVLSMLDVDPFDEPSVRRLMRVLGATGHRDRGAELGARCDDARPGDRRPVDANPGVAPWRQLHSLPSDSATRGVEPGSTRGQRRRQRSADAVAGAVGVFAGQSRDVQRRHLPCGAARADCCGRLHANRHQH